VTQSTVSASWQQRSTGLSRAERFPAHAKSEWRLVMGYRF